jgi:uncharacterized Zn-binding protein involved in type VI secretion
VIGRRAARGRADDPIARPDLAGAGSAGTGADTMVPPDTGPPPGDDRPTTVVLELTHPAGASPRVFTDGWVFGARCVIDPGGPRQRDLSDQVRWSGSGRFEPAIGAVSRPSFRAPGANTIELSIDHDGIHETRHFGVDAVLPQGYANVGQSEAFAPSDAHTCPACPHPVRGPVTSGSPTVTVNELPAARVGDSGVAAACCGTNQFTITSGDASVLIDGRPAAIRGSTTQHCGGTGSIVSTP